MRNDYAAEAAEVQREKDMAPNATRLAAIAHEALARTIDPGKRERLELILLNLSLLRRGQDITAESVDAVEADIR